MPSHRSKDTSMSSAEVAADMRRCVMVAAGPPTWADNVKGRLARAARVLGITPRRAKALFYMEAKVIPADEYLRLTRKTDDIRRHAQAIRGHDESIRQMAARRHPVAGGEARTAGGGDPPEVPPGDEPAAR